jgi:hypothetical protein
MAKKKKEKGAAQRLRPGLYRVQYGDRIYRISHESYGWQASQHTGHGKYERQFPFRKSLSACQQQIADFERVREKSKSLPKMMSMTDAKGQLVPDNYRMYRSLGGKLPENQYEEVAAMFIRYTMDIFICGDTTFFQSRRAAMEAFQAWANTFSFGESAIRIFKSIDLVNPYT